jgi:hypothetical protein
MALLNNGMKTVLLSNEVFTEGMNEDYTITTLELFWQIGIEFEPACLTIYPLEVTQAVLKFIDKGSDSQELDLKEWTMTFHKLSERVSPYQFYVKQVELDFIKRTLIASI